MFSPFSPFVLRNQINKKNNVSQGSEKINIDYQFVEKKMKHF